MEKNTEREYVCMAMGATSREALLSEPQNHEIMVTFVRLSPTRRTYEEVSIYRKPEENDYIIGKRYRVYVTGIEEEE